ncbi:MAG: redoxin domain-containing protein [Gemmatimonadetes bacterium]|nr:redoxin domain-containing protein [Gemmatimonadota bacterium]
MNRLPLVVVFLIGIGVAVWATRSSEPPPLGPVDGSDLPAVDTGRVAVGDIAPDFTLESREGEPVTLSELRGQRVLLVFYRGHW